MDAELKELARGHGEPGFFQELAGRGDGEILIRLSDALRYVPARRPCRVAKQNPVSVGHDDAAARLFYAHGRVPPAETPP